MDRDLFLRKGAGNVKGQVPHGVSWHQHYHTAECLTSFPATDKEQQQREEEEEGNLPSLSSGVCIFQMWNVELPLSLPPYRVFLYPQRSLQVRGQSYCKANSQCRGKFLLDATCRAVRKFSPLSQHFLRMRPSGAAQIGKRGLLESWFQRTKLPQLTWAIYSSYEHFY